MKRLLNLLVAVMLMICGLAVPQAAHADALHASAAPNMCVDWNTSTNKIALWVCNGGANQTFFTTNYGQQRYGSSCLTSIGPGLQLAMQPCVAKSPAQTWSLVTDNSAPGALRNESGYCADIQGGSFAQGQQIIAYTCKSSSDWRGRINQIWNRQGMPITGAAAISRNHLRPGAVNAGDVFDANGNKIGIVAQGGLNLVNTNGSNAVPFPPGCNCIVAQGGGNIVAQGGLNIVAQGGLNFAPTTGGGSK